MDTISFQGIEQGFRRFVEGATIVHDITLRREGTLVGDVTVEISLSESSGRISAADLAGGVVPRQTVILPEGEEFVTFTMTIATIDDAILDGRHPFYDESIVFELSNPVGAVLAPTRTRVGATIIDNDGVYEATPDVVGERIGSSGTQETKLCLAEKMGTRWMAVPTSTACSVVREMTLWTAARVQKTSSAVAVATCWSSWPDRFRSSRT